MESKIKEQTDLIAIQEKFGVFEGNILITTKERVDKNLPSLATEIIDEDFAHLICNRVNNWDELVKLNKLYKEYLNYAQHDENCAQAPIDSVDDCDCGLNELVSKIITAEKALILTESKEVKE